RRHTRFSRDWSSDVCSSDLAVTELKTSAVQDGDDYLINGTKIFGTHSADAKLFLVYVRYGPGLDGIGSVLIEADRPGFRMGNSRSEERRVGKERRLRVWSTD